MQRLDPDKILQMRGIEYSLHSMQEPHLYVIRKQRRESSTHATPLASYYVINGTVYQSPTAYAVLTSRMASLPVVTLNNH
jgi:mediator of RNA polymerase II transcription subunit 6